MSGYWLLLFIFHNFPPRYGGFVNTTQIRWVHGASFHYSFLFLLRQTVPWNQWSFCLWRYHFRTQQIQQLLKCMVSQSSAWQGRAFVQYVIKKDFSSFSQLTQPSIFMVALSLLLLSTSSNQKQHATQMCCLQPRSQSTWAMLRWEKQLLWRAGKAIAAGRAAEPKGKMKWGEKIS